MGYLQSGLVVINVCFRFTVQFVIYNGLLYTFYPLSLFSGVSLHIRLYLPPASRFGPIVSLVKRDSGSPWSGNQYKVSPISALALVLVTGWWLCFSYTAFILLFRPHILNPFYLASPELGIGIQGALRGRPCLSEIFAYYKSSQPCLHLRTPGELLKS